MCTERLLLAHLTPHDKSLPTHKQPEAHVQMPEIHVHASQVLSTCDHNDH